MSDHSPADHRPAADNPSAGRPPVYFGPLEAGQSSRQVSATAPGGIPLVRACGSRREAEEFLVLAGLDPADLDDDRRVHWTGDRGVWPYGQ
jgi:hypothetical protein